MPSPSAKTCLVCKTISSSLFSRGFYIHVMINVLYYPIETVHYILLLLLITWACALGSLLMSSRDGKLLTCFVFPRLFSGAEECDRDRAHACGRDERSPTELLQAHPSQGNVSTPAFEELLFCLFDKHL